MVAASVLDPLGGLEKRPIRKTGVCKLVWSMADAFGGAERTTGDSITNGDGVYSRRDAATDDSFGGDPPVFVRVAFRAAIAYPDFPRGRLAPP